MKGRIKRNGKVYWLGVLLISTMLLGGCGENEGQFQAPEVTKTPEVTKAPEATKVPEATKQPESTKEPAAAEISAPSSAPIITTTERQENRYNEDAKLLVEGTFQTVEVSGEGYEAVAETIREWFGQKEEAFVETVDQYEKYAGEALEYAPAMSGYFSRVKCFSTRADSSVISIQCVHSDYSGGAHGNYGSVGATFDVGTGQKLSFWDLAEDRETFAQKTLDYVLKAVVLEYGEGLFADYEKTIRAVWEEEPNWYLDGAGITVIFNPYEIGPYAMGEAYVTIPYQEFAEFIKLKYRMGSQAGVAVLPEEALSEICLEMQESGELAENIASLSRLGNIYILRREDEKVFLLFDGDMASDDYVTYVYEITDSQVRKAYESVAFTSIKEGSVTPQGIRLGVRVDALGTYTAYGDFAMAEDGSLEPAGEWYSIETTSDSYILTNIRDLPMVVDGQEVSLPAGSRLRIIGTDTKGILRCLMVDSTMEGEIHFTREKNDWRIFIDGVAETEYFEDLPYAG